MKKESSKKILLFLFGLIFIIILISIVFAQENTGTGLKSFANDLRDIFKPLFIDKAWGTQVLFFLLLYAIIFEVSGYLFTTGSIYMRHLVSIIISILAILSIPPEFLAGLVVQYGAMGATILAVVPFFILITLTLLVDNAIFARFLWIVYILYHFILYSYKVIESYTNATGIWAGHWWNPNVIPHIVGLIIGIIIVIFIQPFREAVFKVKLSAFMEEGKKVADRAKTLHKLQRKELEGYTGGGGI